MLGCNQAESAVFTAGTQRRLLGRLMPGWHLAGTLLLGIMAFVPHANGGEIDALVAKAESGDASAQLVLGLEFVKGERVGRDLAEAARWIKLSAGQDYSPAQYALGLMYQEGKGVVASSALAEVWLRRAADQGHVQAQLNIGVTYATGVGVERNPSEAAKYLKLAAKEGEPTAFYYLGALYAAGDGLPQSGAIAADYFYRAGHTFLVQGNRQAALSCAELIRRIPDEFGISVPNVGLADRLVGEIYSVSANAGGGGNEVSNKAVVSGTAFVVSGGYLVTNHHVVEGSSDVAVVFEDGTSVPVTVAATDRANDLILLRPRKQADLPPGLPLSRSGAQVGGRVFTLGYPHPDVMGSECKLTDGVISAKTGAGGDARTYQLNVAVQSGNSGGPLLDMNGEVVGVIVSKLDAAKMFQWTGDLPENVSYAVKLAYLRPLLEAVEPLRQPSQYPSSTANLVELAKRVRGSVALVVAK